MSFFRSIFNKKVGINLVAALLVATLIIWGVFAWLDHYTCHGCAIAVPDLRGYQVELAADITARKDLRYVVLDSIYDERAEPGAIVDQDPKAGTNVKEDRRIYLVINRRERESVAMEDVTDVSPRQAMAMLRSLGLEVGELVPKPSPYVDLVLAQLYKGEKIEAGTQILKGEKITLIVASGASGEKTPVPLLVGLNLKEAEDLLLQHSLNLGAPICPDCQTTEDSLTLSKVWKQRPVASENVLVELGAYIDVWLTLEPDQLKAPNREVTKEDESD